MPSGEGLGHSGNDSDLYSGSSRFESGWGTRFLDLLLFLAGRYPKLC